ncbi:MAG TPA: hypothetical protein DER23_08395 [Clostridiales bacterium]|nr:hypothetical protein [Clostridiales bacterium]
MGVSFLKSILILTYGYERNTFMNIMIMTDLEGISGVDSIDMMDREHEGYKRACSYLSGDIHAAVKGCLDAGADKVFVVDGHGGGNNLDPSLLDPRAYFCQKKEWLQLIESGEINGYMEVGCHAKPGTYHGFLDHTQNSKKIFAYLYNGVEQGEIYQGAVYVGAYDVPFIMVAGDLSACVEGRALLGDIETAIVKEGIGRNQARCLPLEEAWIRIEKAAFSACKHLSQYKPYKAILPLEVKVVFCRTDFCDEVNMSVRGRERLDARTVRRFVPEIKTYSDIMI